jgi:hypothetical protein
MVLGKQTGILELTCGALGGLIGHLSTVLVDVEGLSIIAQGSRTNMHLGEWPIILPGPLDVQPHLQAKCLEKAAQKKQGSSRKAG